LNRELKSRDPDRRPDREAREIIAADWDFYRPIVYGVVQFELGDLKNATPRELRVLNEIATIKQEIGLI